VCWTLSPTASKPEFRCVVLTRTSIEESKETSKATISTFKMTVNDKPVLIIGAGVVGLTLAHGLKKVMSQTNSSKKFSRTTLSWLR